MKMRLWGLVFCIFGVVGTLYCKDLTPVVLAILFGLPALIFGDTSKMEESGEQS